MAPADAGDFLLDEDDDDFFVEYSPHPYRGGYDIAATFGAPLPPSAKTCYPISSSSAATPEPKDPPLGEPYGDEEAPRDSVHESPEVLPNGAATEGKVRRRGWCRRVFWKKCVRVLDYVFCYKDPYAEKRIGVDSYVVPVYANRKQSKEDASVAEVEVTPPARGRVEPHDGSEELVQSNELSWHSNYRNEANTYCQFMSNSYNIPSFAQLYDLPGVFGKPDWFPNFSYSESHQAEEFEHEHSLISGEHGGIGSLFISPFYPRDTEMFERAPGDEHASFQYDRHNLSYQNVYMDDAPQITQPADDSYSMNGSFWPFGEHSAYDV
ncbi:unnamed protein product [Urochloa humidicola]